MDHYKFFLSFVGFHLMVVDDNGTGSVLTVPRLQGQVLKTTLGWPFTTQGGTFGHYRLTKISAHDKIYHRVEYGVYHW